MAMGRPKTANPRTIRKGLVLTPAENSMLEETAAMYGTSQSAVLIRGFIELHQRGKAYEATGKYAKPKRQDEGAETAGGSGVCEQ